MTVNLVELEFKRVGDNFQGMLLDIDLKIQLALSSNLNHDGNWQQNVSLKFEVLDQAKDDKPVVAEGHVDYAALFKNPRQLPEEEFKKFLQVNGSAIIYPYVREAVSNLLQRAGALRPAFLQSINFQALADPPAGEDANAANPSVDE